MSVRHAELDCTTPFGSRTASFGERLVWRLSDLSFLPQSVRQKLRKRFARPVRGPFDLSFEGMKFRLYPAENYCDRVLFGRHKLPEYEEHLALVPFIKAGMTFVDVGANIGSYSAFVGTLCEGDLTLLSFEPHPRTFQKLMFNLESNGLPTNYVFNCGVGPKDDLLSLWSDGGSNIGHTSMLKEGTSNAAVSVEVPVRRLIDVCRECSVETIGLLKIDIEGFEDRALAGFIDEADDGLLPKAILIETAHQHLWERDLIEQLKGLGYSQVFNTPENVLLTRAE